MKKTLLGASVLVLGIATAANTAARDSKTYSKGQEGIPVQSKTAEDVVARTNEPKGPGLEISGGTSFNTYLFKNKLREGNGGKGRGHHFTAEDSRINFEVFGKAGPELDGLEYSFLIGFTGNTEDGTTAAEENRLKFKGRWGTSLLGVHRGVTDFMAVGAFNSLGGVGGILGNYKGVVNETTGILIRDDLVGVAKDNTKVTYVTPRYNGVQCGYSFTPDGKHKGEAKLASRVANKDGQPIAVGQQIHEVGLNYKNTFPNGFDLGASLTSVFARPQNSRGVGLAGGFNKIKSYALGITMKFKGFSLGGEFLDNSKSLTPKITHKGNAGKLYTVGTGYGWGKHGVSLGYLHGVKKLGNNRITNAKYGSLKSNVYSASYDYNVAPGLKVYTEAVNFDYKASSKTGHHAWALDTGATTANNFTGNNKGHAVVFGTAISF